MGSNISTYSEYSKPNNLYRIDAQQLVENTKSHKAERHHIPLPENTITSRSESVLSASNLNRSFSNLLRVSPKPIAEMECTNISSNMDKSLPKLPVEMWLQILKDSVLNETDRDNFAMVSKLHYRIYKSVMNITIYFLYSSAASKIFTDNDLKILQEQAHNGQITEASFSNTKMFKKNDPSLEKLTKNFLLGRLKKGNFCKALQLLNSNSLEEHKYVQKGRLGRIHRYCPNLTRKDLVELDICNPKEDDDKYGVSIQLGYHILKHINTFFTQEEEIDVDAAFEIGASYIDKEIIYCYKMGRQDVVALKIKSNMFLNIEEDRAVWKAVRYDQKELLRQLLEAGFTPNDHYAEGGPVTSAVKRGKLDLLQLLLEYGADVNWEKLSLSLKELLKTAEAEGDPNINKIKALLATKNAPIDLVRLSPKS